MMKKIEYNFKENTKKKYILANAIGFSGLIECSLIIEQYSELVIFISSDIKKTDEIKKTIKELTNLKIMHFKDWETLPFDCFSPHCKIISSRLSILYNLKNIKKGLLIVSLPTLLQKVCSYQYLIEESIYINKNDKINFHTLIRKLYEIGYEKVNEVIHPGEFSYNLSLIDIYPMGNIHPCRIHVLHNYISRLHHFNIFNQLTFSDIHSIIIMPKNEFPIHKNGIQTFCKNWKKNFKIDIKEEDIYQSHNRKLIPGIEYWQPFFFQKKLITLFHYLSKNTLVIYEDTLEEYVNNFWKKIKERHRLISSLNRTPLITPQNLWITKKELLFFLKQYSSIEIKVGKVVENNNAINLNIQKLPIVSNKLNKQQKINYLISFFHIFSGKIIFFLENKKYLNIFLKFLQEHNINPEHIKKITDIHCLNNYFYTISHINRSFINKKRNILFICEKYLLPILIDQQIVPIIEKKKNIFINNQLSELKFNHPIVHLEHGIGRYQGLKTIEIANIKSEYVVIKYAEEDKLYVPISYFHLISPYTGISQENIPLHKLGGSNWIKEKKKIHHILYDHAVKLLDIYAHRASKTGFSFQKNTEEYKIFCKDFPFELTLDQKKVITSVLNDMHSSTPMDRVICGDVGFGKTEVAMRAAFIAVSNNKQVAILVPTTLLAQQHFDSFKKRFSNWSFQINMLSRFCTQKKQNIILDNTQKGNIHILIGTHKILLKNINWYNLGLLIIDEEHKFGVRHKEIIQQSYSNIDILTLTATPIPRTLNMAMTGIKDLSIIANPPSHRLSIKTFVQEYNSQLIRETILREILRGGQVYYIYNKVKNINNIAKKLSCLIPEADIQIGHGKMNNIELKKIINNFYQKKFNVLVCTTIIESGIDIPSANTIIIENADHFGLSQLHQLRGRVGRSNYQAYAWLLVHNFKKITEDAKKRLEAFLSIDDFGAGFSLANQDLEIRGVGELLGKEQSGHINSIGFNLYIKILKKTVKSIQHGDCLSLNELIKKQPEIDLSVPVLLPKNYIADVNTRLYFYKKIASTSNIEEVKKVEYELHDRYGKIPDETKNLLLISEIRLLAEQLGINRIKSNDHEGFIEFDTKNDINIKYLLQLLQEEQHVWKIISTTKLKFIKNLNNNFLRITWIKDLLKKFKNN
ncbi:transcription-repair coupling factor [Buchnera aphidicola]|uniref:transcription-repair coupling factor n=1 Tax=Buchnera aphidicola TaxID=9 RepID=UPI003464C4F4